MTVDELDILTELQDELFWKDSLWIKTPTTDKGHFAVFPKTVTDVDAWEARNIELHRRQELEGPIYVEPKPTVNSLRDRRRITRGD